MPFFSRIAALCVGLVNITVYGLMKDVCHDIITLISTLSKEVMGSSRF